MLRKKHHLAGLFAGFATASAAQQPASSGFVSPLPPETPLAVDGPVRVDAADFEGNILRVPKDRRAAFRMSYDRVAAVVDNVFVTRSIAQKARDAGMDKDPAIQARLRQVQDALLADLYMQKLEEEGATPNLEQRARELYTVDKEKYLTDEEDHVEQILIGNTCYSNQEAKELARRAYAEAKSGKEDFLTLAAKYSDKGEKAHKGGDIGTGPVKRLVAPVREALAKMKPGDISEPVESSFGYHVLKLIERKPAQPKPFDAVKQEIVAGEKAKAQRKLQEDVINGVRNSATVTIHRDNVAKLVAPGVDVEELTRKARAANTAPGAAQPAQQPK
jgi:parvulin-like peptidyl-prolyl isomerase